MLSRGRPIARSATGDGIDDCFGLFPESGGRFPTVVVDRAISEQATGERSAEIPAFAGMTAWARDEGLGGREAEPLRQIARATQGKRRSTWGS